MKYLDYLLQNIRIGKAIKYIPLGSTVLDIGCSDGRLFKQFKKHISRGIGIDSDLMKEVDGENFTLYPGRFPTDLPSQEYLFDVITLLAVIEHIPVAEQNALAKACAKILKKNGKVIITTPAPVVDKLLAILLFLHLMDGMSLEQHFGFDPKSVPSLFLSLGFRLIVWRKSKLE